MEQYVREKQLGRGAMGSVFLVRRVADGHQLAMKTVGGELLCRSCAPAGLWVLHLPLCDARLPVAAQWTLHAIAS